MAEPRNAVGARRFGIHNREILGVSIPKLRALAKRMGKNHGLAAALWHAGILETRILASLIDEPAKVTPRQMDNWVKDLESWADCDAVCGNLFDRTPHAVAKAEEWIGRSEEYVKRAGYVLMAALAVHDKVAADELFLSFLPMIIRGSDNDRNFVKKAVNWALRQIGKRNVRLQAAAIQTAERIAAQNRPSARWIAADALRELKRTKPKNLPHPAKARVG